MFQRHREKVFPLPKEEMSLGRELNQEEALAETPVSGISPGLRKSALCFEGWEKDRRKGTTKTALGAGMRKLRLRAEKALGHCGRRWETHAALWSRRCRKAQE